MNTRQTFFLTIIIAGVVAMAVLTASIFRQAQQLASRWNGDAPSAGITAQDAPSLPPGAVAAPTGVSAGDSLDEARRLFAENCVACHGDSGQGSTVAPPLNTPALRQTDSQFLQNTITFGRPGTAMPAWGQKAGGPLSAEQIGELVALIRTGGWSEPAQTAGAAPPPAPTAPFTGVPSQAINLFSQNCATCHGPTGEGSFIAPPLNSAELRARLTDEAIAATIRNGRPGTRMPAWGSFLSQNDIASLVTLIRHWDSLSAEQLQQMAQQSGQNRFGGGMMGGGMMGGRGGGMMGGMMGGMRRR